MANDKERQKTRGNVSLYGQFPYTVSAFFNNDKEYIYNAT